MSLLSDALQSGVCPVCEQPKSTIDRQFSFGYYAGVMCTECAIAKFRDGCGHNQPMGDPQTLDDYGNDGDY